MSDLPEFEGMYRVAVPDINFEGMYRVAAARAARFEKTIREVKRYLDCSSTYWVDGEDESCDIFQTVDVAPLREMMSEVQW